MHLLPPGECIYNVKIYQLFRPTYFYDPAGYAKHEHDLERRHYVFTCPAVLSFVRPDGPVVRPVPIAESGLYFACRTSRVTIGQQPVYMQASPLLFQHGLACSFFPVIY